VKVFKGEVSPDGHMRDEVDIACALDHPNLTRCASAPAGHRHRGGFGASVWHLAEPTQLHRRVARPTDCCGSAQVPAPGLHITGFFQVAAVCAPSLPTRTQHACEQAGQCRRRYGRVPGLPHNPGRGRCAASRAGDGAGWWARWTRPPRSCWSVRRGGRWRPSRTWSACCAAAGRLARPSRRPGPRAWRPAWRPRWRTCTAWGCARPAEGGRRDQLSSASG